MAILLIQHPVGDYEGWKKAFDSDPLNREESGVLSHTIYQAADDPKWIVVELEFGSVDEARTMLGRLRPMWDRVGAGLGFGSAPQVQARVLSQMEWMEY